MKIRGTIMSFDLENAIAAWRSSLEYNRAFQRDDLDELEQHVRDQVAAMKAEAVTEEEAFARAMGLMGDYGTAEAEYEKVYWGKVRHRRELLNELTWRASMFKNYVRTALRNLLRQKGYTFINVVGLAVGMAVCLVIAIYVRFELSYDQFHTKADRIYRIVDRFVPLQEGGQSFATAATPALWAPALVEEFPEVEQAARLLPAGRVLIRYEDQQSYEEHFAWANATIFKVFTFSLVRGDPATALTNPNGVVISESAARRYFGEEDPLGKTLNVEVKRGGQYEVTGVMQDMPAQSHIRFDFLASMAGWQFDEPTQWVYHTFYSYLLLREGASAQAVEDKLPGFLDRHMGATLTTELGSELHPSLQPLTRIHLYSSHLNEDIAPQSDIRYVYVFSLIALFVLLIACVNFTNLSTARATKRAKEVGVRKVLGAQRAQLIWQFLGEAVLLAFVALVIAILLVEILLPVFSRLSNGAIPVAYSKDVTLMAGLAGMTLSVSLLAGSYPAFILSRFHPARVMKGASDSGATGSGLRKALVVFQFAVSVVLIAGTVVVWRQLTYMQHKRLGFDKQQVIVLPIQGDMLARYDVFRQHLVAEPGVLHVGAASNRLGTDAAGNLVQPEGQEPRSMQMLFVDLHFAQTLNLEIVKGRNLSGAFPSDEESAFLINETAAEQLGWEDPIGKTIAWVLPDSVLKSGMVVGMVRDFHIKPLHEKIEPLVLFVWRPRIEYVYVRVVPGQIPAVLAALEDHWRTTFPANPFPFEYTFLDDYLEQMYQAEQRLAQTVGYFSGLAVLIASLGLFGLAAFTAQQRTKEIGVRKMLGASVPGIVTLLSKDFLKLVGIAFVIAAPLAYFGMQRWLQDFAYRIELGPGIFILTGVVVLLIAVLTVSYQAVRAALADPVKSLRYE